MFYAALLMNLENKDLGQENVTLEKLGSVTMEVYGKQEEINGHNGQICIDVLNRQLATANELINAMNKELFGKDKTIQKMKHIISKQRRALTIGSLAASLLDGMVEDGTLNENGQRHMSHNEYMQDWLRTAKL